MPSRFARSIVIASLISTIALAQVEPPPERPERTPIPSEGFWPTKKLLGRMFDRMSEAVGDEYELDDQQRNHLRELLDKKLVTFLDDNRGEAQTLLNQFLEAQFDDKPPTADEMASWSLRVLPLLEKAQDTFGGIAESMKEVLNDDQVFKLETEFAAFETGMTLVKGKLGDWSAGRFNPESEWFSPGTERKRAQEAERARMEAEMQAAQDARAAELSAGADARQAAPDAGLNPAPPAPASRNAPKTPPDEWTRFTENFIKRYDLDHDQRQKAEAFLRAKQVDRDAYLQRKSAEVERITKLAVDAVSDDEKREAKEASDRLYRPVDRMFEQLKEKLDTLPTRAQRQKAVAESQPVAKP